MKKTGPTRTIRLVAVAAGAALAVAGAFESSGPAVERYGMVIGLKPDKVGRYEELHAAAWPGVLEMLRKCHIRNYSIYLKEVEPGKIYLFSYFEYTGTDFAADMARMAADPVTQKWWKETDPCQEPIPLHGEGEWWSRMKEVFRLD